MDHATKGNNVGPLHKQLRGMQLICHFRLRIAGANNCGAQTRTIRLVEFHPTTIDHADVSFSFFVFVVGIILHPFDHHRPLLSRVLNTSTRVTICLENTFMILFCCNSSRLISEGKSSETPAVGTPTLMFFSVFSVHTIVNGKTSRASHCAATGERNGDDRLGDRLVQPP